MSTYPIFSLPMGITWQYKKTARFNNVRQDPQSGRHPAVATVQQGVLYEFELNWNYLKQKGVTTSNDIQYMQEFYEANGGGFGLFQFDPSIRNLEDLSITHDYYQLKNGFCGNGDGVKTSFPMWRSTNALGAPSGSQLATFCERIQNVTGLYGVYVGGVMADWSTFTQTNFPATLTFHTPPSGAISWEGTYSYLCQFAEDTQDFDEFLFQLWELKSLKLETINL